MSTAAKEETKAASPTSAHTLISEDKARSSIGSTLLTRRRWLEARRPPNLSSYITKCHSHVFASSLQTADNVYKLLLQREMAR